MLETIHLPQVKLVVLKGPERGRDLVTAAEAIRIGKATENDLVINEETVSRMHCELIRDARGYLLRDLNSTNGTFLDGAEIREAYVRSGSVITAGAVQIKFQSYEEKVEIAPSAAEHFGGVVGPSAVMRQLFGLLERVAPSEVTLLLAGEAGTGKTRLARAVHGRSRRAAGPLVIVDCGRESTELELELLGQDRSAHSGAVTRQGALERAQGGTLLLDEVGELSLDLQLKLVRILEQREVRRIGGSRPIKLDVRVFATTRRDLRHDARRGRFRDDLLFRLSTVTAVVPPLRERAEDIPALARELLRREDEQEGAAPSPGPKVPPRLLEVLTAHDWPGNVAELRAFIEHAPQFLLGEGSGLLRLQADGPAQRTVAPDLDPALSYRANKERSSDEFERRYLVWLMARVEGNISRAAREADMDRKHLHKLLKKHNLVGSSGGE